MTREMCVCMYVRVCLVHIESAFESSFLIYGEFAHLFALPRKQLLRTNMPAHNNGKSTVKLQNVCNETIVCVSAEMMITYHLFFSFTRSTEWQLNFKTKVPSACALWLSLSLSLQFAVVVVIFMRTLYASKHSDRFMSLLSIIPFISIYNIRWIYPFLGLPTRPIRQLISDSHTGFYCFIIISTVLFFIKSKITMTVCVRCICFVHWSGQHVYWELWMMMHVHESNEWQMHWLNWIWKLQQLKLSKPFGNKIIEPFCKVLDF